jgi:hypothetical protein
MAKRTGITAMLALLVAVGALVSAPHPATACGGFFCITSPIDQNAERIIFTQNADGTVSAYIQIQYTGSAPDFSWILPLPAAIALEDIEVPDDAMAAFTELEVATDPVFIPPKLPRCAADALASAVVAESAVAVASPVEVFAAGEVGPYGLHVIGSEDPQALITWLREHNYRVTEPMEPLIDVYVREGFAFLAMRLLPEQNDQDVQPVKVTYPSERPMIPLRLTAVAANPDMAVMVWFYAESQAVPENYASMEVAYTDLTFFTFGGSSNYRQLMGQEADAHDGQAFITEYAGSSRELTVGHPLLQELRSRYSYVTRLNTVISPEEMTLDPVFDYDPQLKDVSNIHDLSDMVGLFDCERELGISAAQPISAGSAGRTGPTSIGQPQMQAPAGPAATTPATTPPAEEPKAGITSQSTAWISGLVLLAVAGLAVSAAIMGRRARG